MTGLRDHLRKAQETASKGNGVKVRRPTGTKREKMVAILRGEQEGRCFYCRQALGDDVTVDHFIPLSRGGGVGIGNSVLAHLKCNREKSDQLPGVLDAWRFIKFQRKGGRNVLGPVVDILLEVVEGRG